MTDAIRKARDDLKAALYARENNTTTMVGQLNKFASASRSALSAIDAALEGGAVPKVMDCATEGCGNPATVHFERGGVGSDYCCPCYLKIQSLPSPPTGA